MAKTLVVDSREKTQVPFLRGILTRSLQESGLQFDRAYELADEIREALRDSDSVSTRSLRATVLVQLRSKDLREAATRYLKRHRATSPILIEEHDGSLIPFSRGRHERSLVACGIRPEEAAGVTQRLYEHLIEHGTTQLTVDRLGGLTHGCLRHDLGDWAADRFIVWTRYLRSGDPLILLIGGAAGSGKSTTAASVANQLEIVRTQSTDMLREIMRLTMPKRLLPVLHASSFDAWRALPMHHGKPTESDELLAAGYRAQAELLSVACEAVVTRALRERVSLVLEGVHVHPALIDKLPRDPKAVVVSVMLAVLKRENLRRRIRGRGAEVPQRRAARYLKHFDEIWRLQSILLADADRAQVSIIDNDDREQVYLELMRIVFDVLMPRYEGSVADTFGGQIRRARELRGQ